MNSINPGIFKHFKGNHYRVLFTALDSETEEDVVVYLALKPGGKIWTRRLAMFTEAVLWPDGALRPRFVAE